MKCHNFGPKDSRAYVRAELPLQGNGVVVAYSPPEVDRIWLWVYNNKTPIYLISYLLKGEYI